MSYGKLPHARSRISLVLFALVLMCAAGAPSNAITVGQVDHFQDGTTQGWLGANPENVADAGPNGTGDHALRSTATGNPFGRYGKLVVFYNGSDWLGNWTAADVAQIAMDVRNPNGFPLSMRLAIAGPDGFFSMGGGDTYVTDAISIAADNGWHSIAFGVLTDDFTPLSGTNINAALLDVTHLRILHNPQASFLGANIVASFLVDNIRALAPGDYNHNGAVDAADYAVWRKNDGSPGGYGTWQNNFGRGTASGAPSLGSALAISSVPEPGTSPLVLTTIAFFSAAAPRRRESAN